MFAPINVTNIQLQQLQAMQTISNIGQLKVLAHFTSTVTVQTKND